MEDIKVKIKENKGWTGGYTVTVTTDSGSLIATSSPLLTREKAVLDAQRIIRDWRIQQIAGEAANTAGIFWWGNPPQEYIDFAHEVIKHIPDWEEPKEPEYEYAVVLYGPNSGYGKIKPEDTWWTSFDTAQTEQHEFMADLRENPHRAERFRDLEWRMIRRTKAGKVEFDWK